MKLKLLGTWGTWGTWKGTSSLPSVFPGLGFLQTPLTQSTQLPAIREHFQNHHPNPARDGAKEIHSGILREISSGIYGIRRKSNCISHCGFTLSNLT